MLREAIGQLLPLALGVALSPIPIAAVVLVLGSPVARRSGPAFALGWVLGLTLLTAVALLIGAGADDEPGSPDTVDWLLVLIGVAFLVLAVKTWRTRPRGGEEPEMPRWMASIGSVEPGRALGLGVVLSAANPKNIALTLAASAAITGLDAERPALAGAVFVVLGSVTVAGAVLFYLVAGERSRAPLAAIEQFMLEHNAAIMTVLLLLLGAKMLGDGISSLGH